jgi:replicative DNA helicase
LALASIAPIPPAETQNAPQPVLIPLRALLDEWDAVARELYEAKQNNKPRGAVTGMPKLDAEIGGALLPGVHIAHGIPGIGKTAFALQIAAICGCPCLFVTAEMSPLELLRRLTARVTGTFLSKFKTGELPPGIASSLVRKAITETPFLALLDATNAYASPAAILTAAEQTRKNLAPDNPYFLLVMDSLHSWANGVGTNAGEYDRLDEHLPALRQLAARLKCPVLAISERNRASMDRGGLSAGAGHRGIEYGAESVFDLGCKPDVVPDTNGEIAVTLKIEKNRNGAKGKKIDLLFHGALQRYREV